MDEQPQEQQPQPTPKRGGARERQRRRKERRQETARSSAGRKEWTHLSPSGGFKLPEINSPYARPIAMTAGAVLFMIILIFVVSLFSSGPKEADPNGIWLGVEWTYQAHEDDEVRDLVKLLHEHKIGTVYAHISELNFDSTWTGIPEERNRFEEVEENVLAFAQQLNDIDSDLQIYGVVNFRTDLDADGYRLDDLPSQQLVSNFSAIVVNDLAFDGVLLNIAPVKDDDENFMGLVRQVRAAIGENALLAIVVPPDLTPTDVDLPMSSQILPGTAWSEDYKRHVAFLDIDQVVLLGYGSYLTTEDGFDANDFVDWVAYQVRTYATVMSSLPSDVELIVSVSTGDNPAYDHRIEHITSGMFGVLRGISQLDETSAQILSGVAIYDISSTDDVEWTQFEDEWVDQ